MSGWVGTLALAIWVTLGFAWLARVGVGVSWRLGAAHRARRDPQALARSAELHAVALAVMPALLLALCLLPGVLAWTGIGDHCTRHADHVHLCPAHPVLGLPASVAWSGFAVGAVALVFVVRRGAPSLRGVLAWRRLDALRRSDDAGFARAASDRPFSMVTGLWRPRVWVSEALWHDLAPAERVVVLAHERAHVRRRDPLRRLALGLLTLPLSRATRASVLRAWTLASERLCDEAAAREVGDRLRVAETIVAVARRTGGIAPPVPAPSFGGGETERRVQALLAPAPADERPLTTRRLAAGIAAVLVVGAATGAVHHTTEHMIDLLLHLG